MELPLFAKWMRLTILGGESPGAEHTGRQSADIRLRVSRLVLILSGLAVLWGPSAHSAMVFGYDFHKVMVERALAQSKDGDSSVVREELSIYVKTAVSGDLNRLLRGSRNIYRSMAENGNEKEVKDAESAVIEAYVGCVAKMWEIRLLIERLEKDDGTKLPSHVLMLGKIVKEETELAGKRGLSIDFYLRNDASEQRTVESSLAPKDIALENLRLARLLVACIGNGIVSGEIPLEY